MIFRIKSSFDTINYCLKNNASIVIISHLGRPDGFNENFSLKPIYEYLKKYFDNKIYFSNDCISQNSIEISRKLKPLQIHLLENLRFYKEEIENDTTLLKSYQNTRTFMYVIHLAHLIDLMHQIQKF